MCPKFLVGLQPRQGGCLSLVGYLHLESAAAPENPGPEIDAQDVDRPGLGGDRPVRISQFRVRRGHGLPAVDVRGTQVNDVPVALRPGQKPCDESCGGCHNKSAAALRTADGDCKGIPLRIYPGDGVDAEVPVRAARRTPRSACWRRLSVPRRVGVGSGGHLDQTRPG
jgi:hypothetical protein